MKKTFLVLAALTLFLSADCQKKVTIRDLTKPLRQTTIIYKNGTAGYFFSHNSEASQSLTAKEKAFIKRSGNDAIETFKSTYCGKDSYSRAVLERDVDFYKICRLLGKLIIISPTIKANGPVTFNEGGNVTLSTNSPSANRWYKNNAAVNNATGKTLLVTAAGTYKVKTHAPGFGANFSNPITVTINSDKGLKVSGTMLKDRCGDPITLHGVNLDVAQAWSVGNWQNNFNILSDISLSRANAVRIVWFAMPQSSHTGAFTLDKLAAYLDKCKTLQLVPVLELYDATVSDNPAIFNGTIMNFWTRSDVKQLLQQRQDYLIINIANEFGKVAWSNNDVSAYRSAYLNAIPILRRNGYTCPLMIDAPDGGASEHILLQNCADFYNADSLRNTMFSVHTYWIKYQNNMQKVEQQVRALNDGIHLFLIGELANWQAESTECAYNLDSPPNSIMEKVLATAKTANIGWLAWEWYNDGCEQRSLISNKETGRLPVLTIQGQKIIDDPGFGLKSFQDRRAATACN